MLGAILTGIALFLLLVIALLAIPISLTFQLSWLQGLRGQIHLEWAFGLIRARLPLPASPSPVAATEGKKKQATRNDRPGGGNPFALLQQVRFRRRIFRFLSDLWRAVHKQNVRLLLRLGLGDPADTGRLWAVVGPLAGLLANLREASVEIEPQFMEAVFEFDGSGKIRFVPLQLLSLVVAFLLSPSFWQGMRQMRRVAD